MRLDDIVDMEPVMATAPSIDWEQRRYELAKAALTGCFANPNGEFTPVDLAGFCVDAADSIINRLKEKD